MKQMSNVLSTNCCLVFRGSLFIESFIKRPKNISIFNYFRVRTLRRPLKSGNSVGSRKIACILSCVTWRIVSMKGKRLIYIIINFSGTFKEVFLEDGNIICGVQQTLPKNKMATSLGLTQP